MSEAKTPQFPPIVMVAGIGLLGFLAADFVGSRDGRTASVEAVVREVMDLKLNPLTEDFRELKKEVRDASSQARAESERTSRRVSDTENRTALIERETQSISERVDRLSDIIRERSLERMKE